MRSHRCHTPRARTVRLKKRVFHAFCALPVNAALRPIRARKAQIDMVLSDELTSAVAEEWHVVEAVHTWLQNLQNLSRPEDINDVDEHGSTVLSLCILAGGIRGGEEDVDTKYLTAIRRPNCAG